MKEDIKKAFTQLFTFILATCLVLVVCWFTWGNITGSISWTDVSQPESYNASVATVDTIFNVGPIVFGIAFALIVLSIGIAWISTPRSVFSTNRVLRFLVKSIYYFGYGLLGLVCILPPLVLGYFLFDFVAVQGNTGSLIALSKWILLLIVAYFSIAGFGYIFKRVVVNRVKRRLAEREYEKNLSELPIGEKQ